MNKVRVILIINGSLSKRFGNIIVISFYSFQCIQNKWLFSILSILEYLHINFFKKLNPSYSFWVLGKWVTLYSIRSHKKHETWKMTLGFYTDISEEMKGHWIKSNLWKNRVCVKWRNRYRSKYSRTRCIHRNIQEHPVYKHLIYWTPCTDLNILEKPCI